MKEIFILPKPSYRFDPKVFTIQYRKAYWEFRERTGTRPEVCIMGKVNYACFVAVAIPQCTIKDDQCKGAEWEGIKIFCSDSDTGMTFGFLPEP